MLPQIRSVITFKVESRIISIDSNITNNIFRKVINVQQEKCRTKNGHLRNSSINWIFLFLWRLSIQNNPKLPTLLGRNYCRKKMLQGKSCNFHNFSFHNNIIFRNSQLFLLQQYNISQFPSPPSPPSAAYPNPNPNPPQPPCLLSF